MAGESKTGRHIRYFIGRQRNESDEAGFLSGACLELFSALFLALFGALLTVNARVLEYLFENLPQRGSEFNDKWYDCYKTFCYRYFLIL